MKILLEKLQKLEQLEKAADRVESAWEKEPENAELEKAFDAAYRNEFKAYIEAAKYIEYMTNGNVDFMTAKKLVMIKRKELLQLLTI